MTVESGPDRLPRGRHGLSREQVVGSQRDRMLKAMAHSVSEQGYAKTSVADVLTRAGVSRETFYEQFSSKEDCFLATFDKSAEILLTQLARVASDTPDGDPFDRIIGAYLDALAAEPAYGRVFLVEGQSVGSDAVRRRAAIQGRFADGLVELLGARAEHERFACEVLVAAIGAMVTTRLALGEHASLNELREPIVDLVRRARAVRSKADPPGH
jgi:AcrR family transcriptional regulator